jgi:hypothetical protein
MSGARFNYVFVPSKKGERGINEKKKMSQAIGHYFIKSYAIISIFTTHLLAKIDRLCGLVVRVSGYRSRGPGFVSRPYQIFWEVGGLEWGPLSLVRTTEELLEWKK